MTETNKNISQQALRQPESTPSSGARQPAGKTSESNATLRKDSKPHSEVVTEIDPGKNKNAAVEVAKKQNAGNVIPVTLEHEEAIAKARSK